MVCELSGKNRDRKNISYKVIKIWFLSKSEFLPLKRNPSIVCSRRNSNLIHQSREIIDYSKSTKLISKRDVCKARPPVKTCSDTLPSDSYFVCHHAVSVAAHLNVSIIYLIYSPLWWLLFIKSIPSFQCCGNKIRCHACVHLFRFQ